MDLLFIFSNDFNGIFHIQNHIDVCLWISERNCNGALQMQYNNNNNADLE